MAHEAAAADSYPTTKTMIPPFAMNSQGKDNIVFRFTIEYSSLKGFWPLDCNNRSIFHMRTFE